MPCVFLCIFEREGDGEAIPPPLLLPEPPPPNHPSLEEPRSVTPAAAQDPPPNPVSRRDSSTMDRDRGFLHLTKWRVRF